MGVIKTVIFILLDKYPEHREVIRHLFGVSADFRALCEDVYQCREAQRYWIQSDKSDAPERRLEYLTLKHELERELEDEITRFLNETELKIII